MAKVRSGPGDLTAGRRFWTVEEANRRIASLGPLLLELRGWAIRLRSVQEEIHRLHEFWGKELEATDQPDRLVSDRLAAEWRHLTRRIEEAVRALQREGIEIKDLDRGLVDFWSMQPDGPVFLCWRRGEGEVGYFHGLREGYRGRRPIPGRPVSATESFE